MVCRLARVLACPPSNMQTQSSPRATQQQALCAQHVVTSLFFLKVLVNFRRAKGLCRPSLTCILCSNLFRYANVDYVVVRSTRHNLEPKKIASYDIMCQWSINLRRRLEQFPLQNAVHLDDKIVARMVPKFHLAAHRQECRADFSLNYEPGAGRRDMEGPERTWFGLQGGGSTKDQGPGYWSDSMDDKFSHWNWTKLVGLGTHSKFCIVKSTPMLMYL